MEDLVIQIKNNDKPLYDTLVLEANKRKEKRIKFFKAISEHYSEKAKNLLKQYLKI